MIARMGERRDAQLEDRESLRRLAAGDRSALADLYRRHGERAFRHALWLLRRQADAEDAVQSVFVKLAGMGAELLGIRHPAAYLAAMVHREALAQSRRADRESGEPAGESLFAAAAPGLEAERVALGRALARLDRIQREAVFLHLIAGFTFREVGRICGAPTFTAASRYRAAMGRLRAILSGEDPAAAGRQGGRNR